MTYKFYVQQYTVTMIDALKSRIALLHLKNSQNHFVDYGPVYLFTTENIGAYMDYLPNMRGQNILSVCASGDHAFECLLRGANKVDLFDINCLQQYVLELKVKMIKNLSYPDFNKFFFDKRNFFNKNIIAPIFDDFSQGLQSFLRTYYLYDAYNVMFRPTHNEYNGSKSLKPSYVANADTYEQLKELLPVKFKFSKCELSKLCKKTSGRYDLILLSNIFGFKYPDVYTLEEQIDKYYHEILKPLGHNRLTEDGHICWHYTWNIDAYTLNCIPQITQTLKSDKYLHKFGAIPVPCFTRKKDAPGTDYCLTMRQQRTR